MKGILIYKCRNCSALHGDMSVPNIGLALACITQDLPFPEEWGHLKPGMTSLHACSNGIIGVSDLTHAMKER